MARKQTRQDAEIDVVDWLRKLPKVELHLHLEGTIQPETLLELSKRHDAEPLTPDAAKKLYVYENFLGFLDSFKAVSARLKGPDDYELITYNMVRDLAAQGVVHAEVYVSFGIIYYWKNAEVEPFFEAIERGRVRGEKDFGTTVYWLIDAVRHFGAEEAAKVFRKAAELRALYPSIIGIGIGGERIGHALSAQNDPELLDILAEKQIPLELNVTSNIRTGCCKSFDEHPVKMYFESGLMVTINSDDPPMFGSNLLEEYVLVQERFEFSLEQMRELAANAVEASFLPPERKLALMRRVEQYGF